MISVVIPIHNQEKNIRRIIDGYKCQTVLPDAVIFVLDRCTDGSEKIIKKEAKPLKHHIIKIDGSEGFSAGITRNKGIIKAMSLGSDYIIMTDGDCVPCKGLVEGHSKVLAGSDADTPSLSCGYRFDHTYTDTLLPDSRITNKDAKQYIYDVASPVLLLNEYPLIKSWVCWSCNIAINRKAAEVAMTVNSTISGDTDRVFSSIFDGKWGGEDGFLGLTIFRVGGNVIMCPPSIRVNHIWHERGHTNLDHLSYVSSADAALKNAIISGAIQGPVTELIGEQYPKDYYDVQAISRSSIFGYSHEGCSDKLSMLFYARNIKYTHMPILPDAESVSITVDEIDTYIKHKAIIDCDVVYTKKEKIELKKAGKKWL